jgi:hypothetical protein
MKERATPMKAQDLTLVGLTEDRQRLVMVNDTGEEFTLPADARLRAALRGEQARLGQLEITMESALRPRDIQSRIRSGASPEEVAAAAQTTLDKVMGFATPVLAERAHMARTAQQASVRRKGADRPQVLSDVVAERLHARNVDPERVEWDAWRRDDGRWTVVADYLSGESARHAEFVFDAPGRYVVADDDEARWLVGEQSPLTGPQPRATPGPRRLTAVGDDPWSSAGPDDELPLGEDAIGLVNGPATGLATGEDAPTRTVGSEPEDDTEDLSATASLLRASGDADWIATQASERPQPPEPRATEPAEPVELGSEADAADAAEVPAESGQPAKRRPAKRNKRPSVPSWDEIMFGGGKPE